MENNSSEHNHVFTLVQHKREYKLDDFVTFPVWYEDYVKTKEVVQDFYEEETEKNMERKISEITFLKLRARYANSRLYSIILPYEMTRDEFETLLETYSVEDFDELMKKADVTGVA